jgi:predicted nucleotidyltransferase
MYDLSLNDTTIEKVKINVVDSLKEVMKSDLIEVVLYGSCARGDYTEDSDIDIALVLNCGRIEAKKYDSFLAQITTELAMKYFAVVNFVCIPYEEFQEKGTWYAYYRNIKDEGEVLYG